MDIRGLPSWFHEHFVQELETKKRALQVNSGSQGLIPRDRASRATLITEHERDVIFYAKRDDTGTLFLLPQYAPSIAPLGALEKVLIKDLRLETHHRGQYIMLRVVTRPYKLTALVMVVEDETGDVVLLRLYHQGKELPFALNITRTSSVCIVKEPYLKTADTRNYALQVDHVSDLIWLSEDDERLPRHWYLQSMEPVKTANDWKMEGDADFESKKYDGTVEKYAKALRCSPTAEETKIIRQARSLAYLQLQRYDEALLDVECFPAGDLSEKGLFGTASAYYGLGKFQDCHASLKLLLERYPANESAKKESARARARLREQSCGEYEWKIMYEATKVLPLSLDNATYLGSVEIKYTKRMGRGLFTTKPVEAGELLLCEKAFAHSYAFTPLLPVDIFMDANTDRITYCTEAHLISTIVQKLKRNPSQMSEFLSLYHGSYVPMGVNEVDGKSIIDTFLVARIVALNSFGYPLTSVEDQYDEPQLDFYDAIDTFIGDMQIVRATRDIPAGEELTFWYKRPENTGYKKRQEGLRNWGFKCKCAICDDDKKTSKAKFTKRNNLVGDFNAAYSAPSGPKIEKAEKALTALENTYDLPATEVPRLALEQPYHVLLKLHAASNRAAEVISTGRQFLNALGFLLTDLPVSEAPIPTCSPFPARWGLQGPEAPPIPNCRPFHVQRWGLMVKSVLEVWLILWTAYAIVAPEHAGMAEACAKTTYKICIGEDSTFDQEVGDEAREWIGKKVCYGRVEASVNRFVFRK